MRQPRFTYKGAFHHCMNRGINGLDIFSGNKSKITFLDLLSDKIGKYRMKLFSYCIMDNHYHLVLQNVSDRMSDFFRNLNTHYANYYRNQLGGKGYVFQGRFNSTIIQDNDYLKMAIIYILQNPIRAGLVTHYPKYRWSSGKMYFNKEQLDWLDIAYVEDLFGGVGELVEAVQSEIKKELPLIKTPLGPILGDKPFFEKVIKKFERRVLPDAVKKRRRDDFAFDSVEKVIWEFEKEKKININNINTRNHEGKRLRAELLVRLHDLAGLTYREIIEFPIFSDVQYLSMAHLYRNARKRMEKKN